jgi:hypothetical protein
MLPGIGLACSKHGDSNREERPYKREKWKGEREKREERREKEQYLVPST